MITITINISSKGNLHFEATVRTHMTQNEIASHEHFAFIFHLST